MVIILSVIFTLCVVIGVISSVRQGSQNENPSSGETEGIYTKEKDITIGDTIKTNDMEITINNIDSSYNTLPEYTDVIYSNYATDNGKIYICIDTNVKNITKHNISCEDIMKVTANLQNGYVYFSRVIPEDTSTFFTYKSNTYIDPMDALSVRFLIECPKEVVENNSPVVLTFVIDGAKATYKYTLSSS